MCRFTQVAVNQNWYNICLIFLLQVESVSKKEKTKQRPQALNTVEMLRVASSALGMFIVH